MSRKLGIVTAVVVLLAASVHWGNGMLAVDSHSVPIGIGVALMALVPLAVILSIITAGYAFSHLASGMPKLGAAVRSTGTVGVVMVGTGVIMGYLNFGTWLPTFGVGVIGLWMALIFYLVGTRKA